MLGMQAPSSGRRNREEGEKPFWISYSDLMTALMVLFLVVMSVSLLIITQELLKQKLELQKQKEECQEKIDRETSLRLERESAIKGVMVELDNVVQKEFAGEISIIHDRHAITFEKERILFSRNDYHLPSGGGELLRKFLPRLLAAVETKDGKKWFRRIVVEGFTDTDGSYLYNLNLSLKRAQSVVCALMEDKSTTTPKLTAEQRQKVRKLFLVGGFSFNSAKKSKEESRRIELRVEFQGLEENDVEKETEETDSEVEIGKCQID